VTAPGPTTPAGTPTPVLAARDLVVTFPSGRGAAARAVDGVNLAVLPGQVVALVGESGCGKTTLARTMLGLQQPASGEILVNGAPLPTSRAGLKEFRRRAQLVLQDPMGSLNPRMTVYESVAEGLRIHKVPDEERRVAEALSVVGLRPAQRFFGRYPHELSGGQRQRVVIAGALVLEPEILIADEPVSSLDASVRGEILALLLQLRDQLGLSIMVVTHDLGLAWNIADRIAVMYLGRIIEVGTTEEVLAEARHPYTRALLSVVPEIERLEPIVLTGEPPDPANVPTGCRFHPRCQVLRAGLPDDVAGRCRGEALAILPTQSMHAAACHALDRG
jgi:oligopeptide/dipeptide ABC transporter ATP-binding protein